MNIMITGCAGFIGSHAVDLFIKAGDNVVGVDCLTYAGTLDNLEDSLNSENFTFYRVDICETSKILDMCKSHNVEWIINFAAETHVDNSIKSSVAFVHSNVDGVRSLLEVCKELQIRIFQISTDEVYGSRLEGSFSEGDLLTPRNPYSATKAAAEHLVTSYSNTYNIEYLMARPSNNFGPRQNDEKFVPTILRKIRNNESVPVYGDGSNVRDWLYVKDNVKMIRNILTHNQINQTYNITTSNEKNNIEIVEVICQIVNQDSNKVIKFVDDRPGHDFRYSISPAKLKNEKLFLESDFYKNIQDTVTWYLGD